MIKDIPYVVLARGHYPAQCSCGHLFLERYQFNEDTIEGYCGFVWCGFCKTKLMVKQDAMIEAMEQWKKERSER